MYYINFINKFLFLNTKWRLSIAVSNKKAKNIHFCKNGEHLNVTLDFRPKKRL